MPLLDRKRFLRHLRPWWMCIGIAWHRRWQTRFDAARASGQLRLSVGRVRECAIKDDTVEVHYRPRRQDALAKIEVARVINCAGPGADYDRI